MLYHVDFNMACGAPHHVDFNMLREPEVDTLIIRSRVSCEEAHSFTIATAAPIGAAGRPNRGGSYETGSDGAAGGPPGARQVPTGPGGPMGTP